MAFFRSTIIALLVLVSVSTTTFGDITLNPPYHFSYDGKGSGAPRDNGDIPSLDNDYSDWQSLYNECVETYVSCKESHEGCEICEQLCMVAAGDCALEETKEYMQNMAMACASGYFMVESLQLSTVASLATMFSSRLASVWKETGT